MWDDARQLNALAVTLTVIAVAFLAWATVGWLTRLPAFAFREVVVTTPLARASGAHLDVGDPRRADRHVLHAEPRRCARVARARAMGARAWRCAASGRAASRSTSTSTRRSRAGTTTRSSTRTATCSSPTTPANCRSSTGPTRSAALMSARYREWSALLAPLALHLTGVALSAARRLAVACAGRRRAADARARSRRRRAAGSRAFVAAYRRTVGALARAGTPRGPRRPALSQRLRGAHAGLSRKAGAQGHLTDMTGES